MPNFILRYQNVNHIVHIMMHIVIHSSASGRIVCSSSQRESLNDTFFSIYCINKYLLNSLCKHVIS